jgi:adenylate kinase
MKYRDSKEIETEKHINENIENKAPNDIDLDVTRNLKTLIKEEINSEDDQNFMNRDLEKPNKNTVIQNKDSNGFEEDEQKTIVGSDNRESNDLENVNLLIDNSTIIDEKTDYLSILPQFKRILDGFIFYFEGFGNVITEYKQLLDSIRKEREELELIYKKINVERLELQKFYDKIIEVRRNN